MTSISRKLRINRILTYRDITRGERNANPSFRARPETLRRRRYQRVRCTNALEATTGRATAEARTGDLGAPHAPSPHGPEPHRTSYRAHWSYRRWLLPCPDRRNARARAGLSEPAGQD